MAYYSKEMIEKARELDLLSYLRQCEPSELISKGPNSYSMRKHSSLKLSNGKWMWWAKGIGGVSALDYLVKVEGFAFTEAVGKILSMERIPIVQTEETHLPKKFVLPEAYETNEQVIKYLFQRGIDLEIIYDCIGRGLLYEAKPYHNAIFIGKDEQGKAAYAAYRGIHKKRILGEVEGSNKAYAFRIVGEDRAHLHVFESAIDVLSYLTLQRLGGKSWRDCCCLSLGGISVSREPKLPQALQNYLNREEQVERITLHLDNDEAGRKASAQIYQMLQSDYEMKLEYPAIGKDVNDEVREQNRNCERN